MQRPQAHINEEISERLLKSVIPPEWVFRKLLPDYGIDYEIEIAKNNMLTGNRFWVQLKSKENIDIKENYIPYSVETKLLNYSISCPFPIILIVADLKRETLYWLPLQDEIIHNLQNKNIFWSEQKTHTVYLPTKNKLDASSHSLEGLIYYAYEPARLRAFAILHRYYHELQYTTRWSGYEIENGYTEEKEALLESSRITKSFLMLALELDVIFNEGEGIDFVVAVTKPMIDDGIKACEELQNLLKSNTYTWAKITLLISKIDHAVNLLSTIITAYQEFNDRYLLRRDL